MSKNGGLSDTKEIRRPKESDPHPQGRAQAPHTAIRRASMTGGGQGKQMPTRKPPSAGRKKPEKSDESNPKAKRKKKGRSGTFGRIMIILLCLIGTVFTLYSAYALIAVNRMQHIESGDRHFAASVVDDKDLRNILLIGTDETGESRGKAESIVLLTLSSHNKTVTLTPVLTECYVSIPGYQSAPLSEAYTRSGAELLADTVSNNFNIRIDEYVSYGMNALIQTCDALGGVDVTVSEHDRIALNQYLQEKINPTLGADTNTDMLQSAGKQHLNGRQALAYARFRTPGNACFETAERQQTIMNAMIPLLKSMSFSTFGTIRSSAFPDLQTNISVGSMYLLSLKLPYYMLCYHAQTLSIPADGTYSDQTASDGTKVLAINFDENTRIFTDAVNHIS